MILKHNKTFYYAIMNFAHSSPELTWRDVQYLIVYTSRYDKLNDTKEPGTKNGAGLTFSIYFGFGAVDAEAVVTRARHWTNVAPQTMYTIMATESE